MLEIIKGVTKDYNNKDLDTATKLIYSKGMDIAKSQYEIAWILNRVNELECYVEDGYHTTAEWAEVAFGFKKSLTSNLIRIGKEYTAVRNIGDVQEYTSKFIDVFGGFSDFTTSQIAPMLPIGKDKVVELVESGEITPEMTVRDIAETVKPYKKKRNKKANTAVADTPDPEQEPAENSTRVETNPDEITEIFRLMDVLKRGDECNISHWVDEIVERLCKMGYSWRMGTVLTAYVQNDPNDGDCEQCAINLDGEQGE